ncbi:YdcF family protein [Chamaesiphon sp. VAR_69_metabat_338]|uniref:YdcF family protein n=1 Tax=Chamaesiphon sp. VAR_69_metabat_338 TaxID=2964704 RepID=UPI00286E6946|nr:YdcF family protein [Chamaesiphon sp. VAR_69_metabat_338]
MKRQKLFKIARFTALLAGGLFALSAVAITVSGLNDNIHQSDVAVILGNHVAPSGRPSPRLQARLDRAVELYHQGIFQNAIVSGGIDANGTDEAAAMKRYLVDRGLPSSKIVVDSGGNNTYLTAQNTSKIMTDRQWHSAIVISEYFHIPRTKAILQRMGVTKVYAAHAKFFEIRDVYSIAREVFGYASYLLRS